MKKHFTTQILIGILSLLWSGPLCAQYGQGYASPWLDSILQVKMGSYHLPGLSASIIKDGQVKWIGTYGMANFEQDIPVDTTTLFMLASISKTVTATSLLQLWEQGLFELDEDINGFTPFSIQNPDYPSDPITFRMLLTHSSSIRDNWDIMPYYWGEDSPMPLGQYLFDYLSTDGLNYDPDLNFYGQAPGTAVQYSNIGAAMMGYLVELIGDSTFAYQTHDRIFEPLQMNETAWFLSELDTNHIAMPYNFTGTGYAPYGHFSYSDYPAGALRTSVDQLSNYLLCYMNGGTLFGEEILQSATVDSIFTPQLPQIDEDIGLIWWHMTAPGRELWGHGGGDLGVNTQMLYCPEENSGVVVLANAVSPGAITLIRDLLFDYAEDSIVSQCLPEGITFSTQEEIDNFQVDHPFCSEIGGDVTIHGADIVDLGGLGTIMSIGGDLSILSNDLLTSLSGLNNLTSIGGSLTIGNDPGEPMGNPALASLEGLENIDPGSITDLTITENPLLSECDIQSICDYLVAPTGTVTIENNATGCNSLEEVEYACENPGTGIRAPEKSNLTLYPNPASNGSITLTVDNPQNLHLNCFNTFGQQVHQQEIRYAETVINVSTWASGIYLAVVVEEGKVVGKVKFVVR